MQPSLTYEVPQCTPYQLYGPTVCAPNTCSYGGPMCTLFSLLYLRVKKKCCLETTIINTNNDNAYNNDENNNSSNDSVNDDNDILQKFCNLPILCLI